MFIERFARHGLSHSFDSENINLAVNLNMVAAGKKAGPEAMNIKLKSQFYVRRKKSIKH